LRFATAIVGYLTARLRIPSDILFATLKIQESQDISMGD